MLDNLFVLVTDTHGQPIHLNLRNISSVQRQGKNGALVTTTDGEKIYLSAEEATKLAPYLDARTSTRPPLITK